MSGPEIRLSRRHEATKLDWSLLDELLRRDPRDFSVQTKFACYALTAILPITDTDAMDAITDASQDRGVDAVVIDEAGRTIDIFQFKYHESEDHVAKQFPARNVDFAISFVTDLLEQRTSLTDTTNKLLQAKIAQIWELISRAAPTTINLHFVSNGRKLDPCQRRRLEEALSRFKTRILEHGAAELLEQRQARSAEKPRRKLQFVDRPAEHPMGGSRMLVGLVALNEIAHFVSDPRARRTIDASVFDRNVRGVLGLKNDVNKAMFRTILHPEGAPFALRNNGITVVAEQVLHQTGTNFPFDLIAPQIVNGAQTASTIFAAMLRAHDVAASNTQSVLVRVIESRDAAFAEQIALSTNSQTRIYGRDLRAIDRRQEKIAQLLATRGYTYLRKRSETSDLPTCQTIDMARLGQLILAYRMGQPEAAKTKSSDIFGDLYDAVFDVQDLNPELIIAVHSLDRMLDERRQLARTRLRSARREEDYVEDWILEGSFHVIFVVALLCRRDEIELWDQKSVASRINEAIEIVRQFVADQPTVAAYRLFRTVGTGDRLEKIVLGTRRRRKDRSQLDLFAEL